MIFPVLHLLGKQWYLILTASIFRQERGHQTRFLEALLGRLPKVLTVQVVVLVVTQLAPNPPELAQPRLRRAK